MPSAYVLIVCELGYEDQTVSDLNTLAGVDATRLAGAYDIIAKINAESPESLSRIIGFDIKKIRSCSVHININCKRRSDLAFLLKRIT
jgi:DNA-binding Lrp family transcriptional regulator